MFGTFRHCFSRMVKRVIFFLVSHDGHTMIKHFVRLNNSACYFHLAGDKVETSVCLQLNS